MNSNPRALPIAALASLLAIEAPAQTDGAAAPASEPQAYETLPPAQAPGIGTLRTTRDALMQASDFVAALEPAEEIVARLEPLQDPELPSHLSRLARVQAELGEFEAAEATYFRAIELLQQREGDFSLTLVEPYRGLARSYIKDAQYPEAITVLEQAQHITQRHLGLFNVEQTELMDDMTTAYLGTGDTAEAQRLQVERLDTAVKRFGSEDPRVIPFRYQLADYYGRSRMRTHAREQYEEVIALQEAQYGEHHPSLLPPLRELVQIDLLTGKDSPARERLLTILSTAGDIPPRERALSLTVLGDWEVLNSGMASAIEYYGQAREAFAADPEIDAERFFARPAMINFIPPLSPVDRRARRKAYSWGTIVLAFDLSAQGHASNVEVVSADPSGLMESDYTERIMETYFRPRLVSGQPAPATKVQLTHYFRYYVDD